MYRHKYAVFGAGCLLAVTIACSNSGNPVSPNAAVPGSGNAGPNGETLKIAAPGTVSPKGGETVELGFGLVIGNVSGTYATFPVTYRWEIRNAAGTTVASGTQAAGSGTTTSIGVSTEFDFDAPMTWRARAEYSGAFGPWSAPASFRTPAGSYRDATTIMDLLTDGETLGIARGPVTFSDEGAHFTTTSSYIEYQLPQTIKNGEFSFIARGVDEGNPCDKCKVMSMAEGAGDVTANDYRMSLEVRGSMYPNPGMVTMRIITGDNANDGRIHDTNRNLHWPDWSDEQTYFFKMYWGTGFAGYEIREGGPDGNMHDSARLVTDGHEYRPNPHFAFLGAPAARGGLANSTHVGMTVRSVWISPNDRPNLPTVFRRPQ
jgi:hypothetical protein